ncbi:MAG: adenylyl-sulfate reductase subunit alpha [Thermodesulfovibrio sp.]|jgi:adenylylsulfate reductase subunit A|uniref:adenylyl-sulfate reductase subunit alpha n=1 Tax=unclassified Thermodesulfovibrio TaxID=2645936 RepID=UPI00083A1358|nr:MULTISPECIES: adenylyl-sulfate reductase subunit alpha [unclassified Thermodesulfovibrio]MDI1472677.1 adenylyl-sulfate reductase subunit alpha [Thermodesulfovibrio sp. 1176]MDI6714787.1 adenylyl-sulfate reductase subunit alpha [Thermodesulfovibrio sp.]ODA44443.1 Adenylylsulfate reductase alpha-subunit [Thermodesulfovibrio sp. N1]
MEKETCTFSYCQRPEVIEIDTDFLIIGGGMAACGAAFEACRWATPKGLKVTMVDKAATDRSGAVAMGLSAINTYIGENKVEDYVRYVRADLMGIIREDLVFDLGRHVDNSVHMFEEWGLPIWKKSDDGWSLDGFQARDQGKPKLKDGGVPCRSGKWQIMINGESYKVIVAEAGKAALEYNRKALNIPQNHFERVFIVKLLKDAKEPNRVAGAIGFSVRENKVYLFKAKAILNASGGAVNVFRPRSTREGMGRAWYPVWNSGSGYYLGMSVGAEMTMMENRFVPARFKDGYGPVGAWFLFFKAKASDALGNDYCAKDTPEFQDAVKKYGKWAEALGTAIRNHLMMQAMKQGRGPILMNTHTAMQELAKQMDAKRLKHLEAEAWEDFLDMCISQAGLWAANNVEPDKSPSEIMPTEPYLLGSHAGCAGFWVSGPGDIPGAPAEWFWGYNRMSTVNGLFMAGDIVGASGHKFSSGSHAEGRIAAKAAIAFILDNPNYTPTIAEDINALVAELYLPFELYEKYKTYSTDPKVNPYYIKPEMYQARLQKIADEYFGGIGTWYMTSKTMIEEGLRKLQMLKEDAARLAAANLHELLRCWENYHRTLSLEAHARHILFREESRYPGYYYRGDFDFVDDNNWRAFVNSVYDPATDTFTLKKVPYVQIIPD